MMFSMNVYSQQEISTDQYSDEVFAVVDEMPEFPGGDSGLLAFFQQNSKHPIVGKDENSKVVYCQIIIDEEGKATLFKILISPSENLSKITEELIKLMPNWKPGKKNEEPVKVAKNISIRYGVLD